MTNYGLGRILFNSLSHIMSELVHKFPHVLWAVLFFQGAKTMSYICPFLFTGYD